MPKCVGDLINTRMGAVEFDMEAVEFGMGAAEFGRRNRAGPLKVVEHHHQCSLLKIRRTIAMRVSETNSKTTLSQTAPRGGGNANEAGASRV